VKLFSIDIPAFGLALLAILSFSPMSSEAQPANSVRDLRPFLYLPFQRATLPGDPTPGIWGGSDYNNPRPGLRLSLLPGAGIGTDYVTGLV
jgi:hypothetical protein